MLAKKKTGLGKGLSALLSEAPDKGTQSGSVASANDAMNEIEISEIEVNPFQPRTDFNKESLDELSESIKIHGIIQPITVRKLSKNAYQLISGERRLQAAKLANLQSIPAYVRTANDQQMLEMALIENIQRENLNAIEIALSYQRLLSECKINQDELGLRVSKNRSTVTNYLRLLKLPPAIQIAIRDGQLTMGHARAIISIEDVSLQLNVFQRILKEGLSVRKVEEYVRDIVTNTKEKSKSPKTEESAEIVKLREKLSSHFGTKIKVKSNNNNKGEISIPFTSTSDLNRIIEILEI